MYTVGVREAVQIKKSLRGRGFSKDAAAVTVSIALEGDELDHEGSVIDRTLMTERLHEVLAELEGHSGDIPAFEGKAPTPEMLVRYLHRKLSRRLPLVARSPIISGRTLTVALEEPGHYMASYRAVVRNDESIRPESPDTGSPQA